MVIEQSIYCTIGALQSYSCTKRSTTPFRIDKMTSQIKGHTNVLVFILFFLLSYKICNKYNYMPAHVYQCSLNNCYCKYTAPK